MTVGDIIAGLGLSLSIVALVYTIIATSKKGPRIGIFGVKYDGSGLVNENQNYWIGIETLFENYGDKAADIVIKPDLILYDSQGNIVEKSTNLPINEQYCERGIGIPISGTVTERINFRLLAFNQAWEKGIIKYNAYYYKKLKLRKKWKKIYLKDKEDQFEIFFENKY